MSRPKFEAIGRGLHVLEDDDDDLDRLQKVRVLIQEIVRRCDEN
jgi:hypothetical protein